MLRSTLPFLLLTTLSACDDAGSHAGTDALDTGEETVVIEGEVTVANTTSTYATCSSITYSALTFSIINNSSQVITPERIDLTFVGGNASRGFVDAGSISPGGIVEYECHGGFTGEVGGGEAASQVTLRFREDGSARSVESTGTHTSYEAFDNCDTAFPDVDDSDCFVVEE